MTLHAPRHVHFHVATLTAAALAMALGAIPRDAEGRPGGGARGATTSNHRVGGDTINRGGDRVTTGGIDVGAEVNIDVDHGSDHDGWDDHRTAAGGAFGAAAAVTSTVGGAVIYSLPPSGSSVTHVVVNPPY